MSARMTIAALAMLAAIACCGCGHPRPATSINERAALTGSLPWNPLQWMVITSLMDNGAATMSTLYGNEIAVQAARSGSRAYPAGAVLALVTWTKQNDEHWFGAKIPASAKSVEFVSVTHAVVFLSELPGLTTDKSLGLGRQFRGEPRGLSCLATRGCAALAAGCQANASPAMKL